MGKIILWLDVQLLARPLSLYNFLCAFTCIWGNVVIWDRMGPGIAIITLMLCFAVNSYCTVKNQSLANTLAGRSLEGVIFVLLALTAGTFHEIFFWIFLSIAVFSICRTWIARTRFYHRFPYGIHTPLWQCMWDPRK